jgi:hypothetical protein
VYCVDHTVDVVLDAVLCHRPVGEVDDGIGCPRVAVAWLADTAWIQRDPVLVDLVVLDVGVTHHEHRFLTQQIGTELRREGVPVRIVGVTVDQFDPVVTDQPFFGQGGQPPDLVLGQRLAGVTHARAGHAVEREPPVARDGPVVISRNRRYLAVPNRRDTFGVPGVVADDVPGTDDCVHGGHVRENRIQSDLVPVNVRDNADAHTAPWERDGLILSVGVRVGFASGHRRPSTYEGKPRKG